jgi:hypothetical protein
MKSLEKRNWNFVFVFLYFCIFVFVVFETDKFERSEFKYEAGKKVCFILNLK